MRNFNRTIAELNTKLQRQRAAVAATEEMIEAVNSLAKTEAEQEAKRNAATPQPKPQK